MGMTQWLKNPNTTLWLLFCKKILNKMVKVAALSQILFLITLPETNSFCAPENRWVFRRFPKEISSSKHPWTQGLITLGSGSQLCLGIHTASKGVPQRNRCQVATPPLDPGFFMAISGWWTITKIPCPPTDDAIIGGKCRFRWFFWGTETFKRWTCWFLQDCTQRGTTQTHFLRTETKQILLRQGLYANHGHWIFEHQHHFLWPLADWKKIDILSTNWRPATSKKR